MTTEPDFKLGDEVRLALLPTDPFHRHYDGMVGTITRIESPDESFSRTEGFYVDFDGIDAIRALRDEISHAQPTPALPTPPAPVGVTVDDIRSHLVRISQGQWTTEYADIGDHFSGVTDEVPFYLVGPKNTAAYLHSRKNVITELSELTSTDFEFIAKAPEYISRLLDIIDTIESACAVSEAHAAPFNDTPTVYADHIRQIIGSGP